MHSAVLLQMAAQLAALASAAKLHVKQTCVLAADAEAVSRALLHAAAWQSI